MTTTIREKLIVALLARGERIEPSRTRRFTVLSRSDTRVNPHVFIGKAGACRVGPNATDSYSFDKLRDILLAEAAALPSDRFNELLKKVPKL